MQTMLEGWSRRPQLARRALDAALVLVCLGLTVLAVKTPWSPLPRWVIASTGTLGSMALLTRRRWPHVAAVAGAVGFALSGNPGPGLVGLCAAARHVPWRQVWLPGTAALAGFLTWLWFDAGSLSANTVVGGVVVVALVVGAGVYLTTREALVEASRAQARHAAAERDLRDEQARTAERTRIAREMHDVLAHKVSLIALHAGALELRAGDDERLRESTALIRTTAREALQELRDVLGVLRSEGGRAGDGASFGELDALVRAATDAGQSVELHDSAGTLPAATARVVYRVVQEGLTNARKHAPGAHATVSVVRSGQSPVTVTVLSGAGTGRPVELPGSGAGLIGLAERLRHVGGTLRSGPTEDDDGGGWELQAIVPVTSEIGES
jgi:signal transduction histidine kinase